MHKFFVLNNQINGDEALITGDDVKHIYKVLRLEAGDDIIINNLQGEEYKGTIIEINKKEVRVRLIERLEVSNESPVKISLYQGLPKASKMDLISQKATELGVFSITPVIMKRVIVKSDSGEFKKIERWQKIALEASKQSKRTIVPSINHPLSFKFMMEELKGMDLIVVPYENAENLGIKNMMQKVNKDTVKNVAIVIGPEGGFEEEEISSLKEIGAEIVTLGPRILRTESAGFVCASIIQYEFGDLGGII